MDRISIPEHLDPSSPIGDAAPEDRLAQQRQSRRKKVKVQTPAAPEGSIETEDQSHKLDELA
jgi:hypothetical protein